MGRLGEDAGALSCADVSDQMVSEVTRGEPRGDK